jgi:hypothetical protein
VEATTTGARGALVLLAVLATASCSQSDRPSPNGSRGARLSALPSDFAVADKLSYTSFEEALNHGQLDFAERHDTELPAHLQGLVDGLEQIVEGRNDEALRHFQAMASTAEDPDLQGLAGRFVANLLYDRGDYDVLSELLGEQDDDGARLVRVLASLPGQRVEAGGPGLERLDVGPRGHPAVEVSANGRSDLWFFDTGASQSVVSASTATELGATPVSAEPLEISTSTSIVRPARVALLDELAIGEVVARNVPVLVYDDDDLTFELDDGQSIRIRGIVGWPIIRELRAELDYVRGRYTASLSTPLEPPVRNFSWIGYPMVSLASESGQPLIFGLDTGSWNTSISGSIFDKVEFDSVRDDVARIGGVGGYETADVRVVDRLGLALAGVHVELEEVRTERDSGAQQLVFFAADGVLGSDIAQRGRLVLDYPNGYLGLEPAP